MDDDAYWRRLKSLTRARIGLGRVGDALPTAALLNFQLAHAQARDAVHGRVDWDALAAAIQLPTLRVGSAAPDRGTYLRRPDLGRMLAESDDQLLPAGPFDIVFIIGDGLSAAACTAHAVATFEASLSHLSGFTIGPVILAAGARVALGDPIGARMNARLAVMLIGERPGLSSADSLGAYLTFAPAPGRRDSERNCISNIHAHGLLPAEAGAKIGWLAREALKRRLTGIGLKEAAPTDRLVEQRRDERPISPD